MLRSLAIAAAAAAAAAATLAGCGGAAKPAPVAPKKPPAPTAKPVGFQSFCQGPDSVPLEVTGSRDFVMVTLPDSKGQPHTLRFQVDSGGNTAGVMILKSAAAPLGYHTAAALPRAFALGDRKIALPKGARWIIVDDHPGDQHGKHKRGAHKRGAHKRGAHKRGAHKRGADKADLSPQALRKRYSVGQLGAGFLSRYTVCVDPGHGRLALADPSKVKIQPESGTSLPILLQPEGPGRALYPFLAAKIGGQSLRLLLDCGASGSMLETDVMNAVAAAHPHWPTATGTAGDLDMIGGAFKERMLRAAAVTAVAPGAKAQPAAGAKLTLSQVIFVERPNHTFDKLFGRLSDGGTPRGAIGNDVLGHYRFIIDYRHGRAWFEGQSHEAPPSSWLQRVGVSVRYRPDGCPEITRIVSTSARRTRHKLRVGDVIRRVGNHDACNGWHHDLAAWLSGMVGEKRTLHIQRGRHRRKVVVPVVNLLPRVQAAAAK